MLSALVERFRALSTAQKAIVLVLASKLLRALHAHLTAKSLRGEVCVITGAGSGIGRLLAIRLGARHGVRLALWDLNAEAAERVAAEISSAGGSARAYRCDVSDVARVKEVAAQVQREVGAVTMLVNNAGIVSVTARATLTAARRGAARHGRQQ
jgi:NAD(P)-dependent dehydrogenase (short-subunit alcohol dehydrogenase family)